MSTQPYGQAGQPAPHGGTPAPGWYPQGHVQRWWDGQRWTEHTAPLQQQPQIIVQQVAMGPRSISGMSNGARIKHIILSVMTCGAWLPMWLLIEWLGRRKVNY